MNPAIPTALIGRHVTVTVPGASPSGVIVSDEADHYEDRVVTLDVAALWDNETPSTVVVDLDAIAMIVAVNEEDQPDD